MSGQAVVVFQALVVLTVVGHVTRVKGDSPCLPKCTCSQRWVANEENTFHLRCGRFTEMTEAPDWSGLRHVKGSISLALHVGSLPGLQRQDFPSGFPIVSVEIHGDTAVADDAFHNVRDTLEELEVSGLKLNLSRPLAFLAHLPHLKRLALEDFGQVEGEDQWTGSPFKDLGLNLLRLSIRDQEFTDIGPNVFRDVSAEALVLEQNGLVWFPGQALRQVAGLRSVSMAENSIKMLEDGDTEGLALDFLDLSDNLLVDIQPLALDGVRGTLVNLSLRGNKLERVPVAALSPLQALKELDVSYNTIEHIAADDFQGGYCLERLRLGGYIDEPHLRAIEGGAFRGHGGCLRSVGLGNTRLEDFPTAAVRELSASAVLTLESDALTELRPGAFSGVGVKKIVIGAPLTAVHPGAFQGLRHHPLSLVLENTELGNASFFYEYPAGTFLNLHVFSYRLPCDCELAGIRRNLQLHKVTVDGRLVSGNLTGVCRHGEDIMYLGKSESNDLFENCSNFTLLDPRTPPPYVHVDSKPQPDVHLGSRARPGNAGSALSGWPWCVSFALLHYMALVFS